MASQLKERLVVFVKRPLGQRAVALPCASAARAVVCGRRLRYGERAEVQQELRSEKPKKEREEGDLLCSRARSAPRDEAPTDFRLLGSCLVELLLLTLCCAARSQLDQGLTVLNIRKDVTSAYKALQYAEFYRITCFFTGEITSSGD